MGLQIAPVRPAGQARLDHREDGIERHAKRRQNEEPGEDQRHLEARAGGHHHIADAPVRGDGFGDDRSHEGQRLAVSKAMISPL